MLQPSRSQKAMKFFVVCWPSVLVAGQRARAILVLLLQPVLSGVELLQQLRYCRCTRSCCAAVTATPLALRLRCISCCSWLFFCQCCWLASRDFEEGETDTRPTYEPEAQQEANENTRRTDMQETVTPVQHQQPVLNRTTPESRQAAQEDVGDEEGEGEAASPAGTAGRQDRAERGGSDRKSTVNASEKGESEAARMQTSQRETKTSFTAATEQQPAAVAEANMPEADGSSARGAVDPAAAARTTSDTDSDATNEAVAATSEVVGAAEVAGGGASAAEASTYDIGRRDAAEETDAPAGETTAAAEDTVAAADERTVSGRDAGDVAVEGTAALNGETDVEAAEESAAHAVDTAAPGETSAAEERDAPTDNFDEWIAADSDPETNTAERGKIDVSAGEVSSEENAAVDPYEETVFDDNSETIEADNTGGGEKANNEEETATTAEGGKSVASLDERQSRNTQSAAPDDNATASRPPVAGKTDSASEETDVTAHAVEDRGNVEKDTEAAFLSPASAARSTFDEEVAGVAADQAGASSDEEGVPAAQPASFPAASTAAEEVTNEAGRGKRLTAVNTDDRGEKNEAAEEETSREEEGQEEGENNRHPHHQHVVENLEDWAVTEEASKQKLQERGDETPATEEQRPEWRAAAAAEPTDLPAELAARTATGAYTSSPGGELLEGSHGFPSLSRRNSERDSHEEETTEDLGEETIENLEDDDDWTEGASDEEEEGETEHRGREKETETEETLHEKEAGEEGAKEEEGHELEEADREELERVEDGAGGEAEGTIVRDEEENATAGEWEEQEKHRESEETEEKREEREVAEEEKESGRVERNVEEMLARERETTLNAGTAAQQDQAQQQAEVQQANTGQEQQGGGEAAGEGHEETEEDTEDDETEEMEAESGKGDETEEEEKRKEGLDGGGDEEEDERRKEAGFESPVNQDGSSAEEKVARGEQLEEDSYVEEAVQQVEKDEGEEALRRQATTKGALLQAGGGREEAGIGHTEVAQQQMDEQEEFSQNENKEQEESPANLQVEEQENAALMQGEELPERQEDWQREDGIQETEATDTLPKTDESEGGMTEERKNALRAFIRKQVEAENDLPGHEVEESEEDKARGELAFLPDVGSQLGWQDKAEKQKTEAGQEQKGEAEVEGPVLETKGVQAGEREHHLLGAQEPDSEKEAKPDKEQEKIEEDVKVEAILRGEKEDQAHVGREDAESRTGKLSTEEEEVAEQEKDAEEQAAREARPDGEGEVQTEENAPGVLMQRQETKLTLAEQAARGHQRRADEAMQQLSGLISSLDALAKRFEEQQKQLKEKHQQEKHPEVYPPEDTEVQKQEQLLKESEERLPALLRKHEQLLGRLREERQRMLEGGNKTPGPLRGPVIGMGSSGEQTLQHQHTEMLTAALANAAERFGTTIQQVNECCTAFVRDHDRALQVLYEYGRAVDLLNMGVRMNKLSEREIKERLRACTEAFSVLSELLVTCDNRVASIMGLTRALEATQGLALARLELAIEAQEHEEAGAATVGRNTAATELAPKKLQQQAGPRSDAQQTEEQQLLEAARQAVDVLERLGISVAEATRTVVNARAKWMEELSTHLLRHFDGLVKVGKQLRLREERRRRMELTEATKHTAGRHGRKSSWEDELPAHTTAFRADRHREPRRSWENQRMAGTSMFPRRGRRKTLPERDRYYGDSEGDEKYKEDHYGIASQLAWKGFPERIQRRDRPFREQLQPTFRRQAEEAAGQCYGRAQNHLLRDVNLEGWKAIQQMAEGAKVASKVARDTREAIEKEVSGDTTTAVLGALLGIALLLLLALVLYGYYMVFSYEERVNAYRIGNKAGQTIDKTDEGKATVAEKVKGRFTRERGSRRQAE